MEVSQVDLEICKNSDNICLKTLLCSSFNIIVKRSELHLLDISVVLTYIQFNQSTVRLFLAFKKENWEKKETTKFIPIYLFLVIQLKH
ncbi:CLUMA_CG017606, isoform A [Clunio marinus]|uniref:CLUMA_CG017606, isoform A n=1 Tax=Clunio marinus TaxID=568069 RepID=A0A1J1IW79_9DIPT|nr:CLUMA_CG017606, isoform A [Clunio marinus]